ncbi:carboxymethylenebutenolidase [Paenarthrobacter nicotinovorans]|uniref:dienelactone hydrolase family protein n=1 Tax=Micrococcaceae TaxID=1268 RepID=UPI000876E34B|nr:MULTISPECIES: dienelactone hydrolase family protein [Micrococcaceae]MDR6436159.1 carboxymethylenebutenolidase [Paenarthrobacter nicotinovorans]SCZ64922.1 Dienelactone hydrolase family protein [Arthrobacter sp. UNCCL28]
MVQLEKFEKYLIEEFYDDFRTGEMSHKTFTRRVAFIIGEYDRVCGGHDPGGLYTGRGARRHVDDFKGAFEYLNGQDFVEEGRVAMIGFCFGGGITWQASTEIQGLKATSAFYGPAPDPADVPTIKPAVFGVYAENDARITGAMPQFQEALERPA